MKTNYIPGPWYVDGFNMRAVISKINSTRYAPVCVCNSQAYGDLYSQIEREKAIKFDMGNAKLIAAAPDLLEAAQCALEYLLGLNNEMGQIGDNGDQAYQLLQEAILKAIL